MRERPTTTTRKSENASEMENNRDPLCLNHGQMLDQLERISAIQLQCKECYRYVIHNVHTVTESEYHATLCIEKEPEDFNLKFC